jgi:hypothetical protein
MAFANVKPVCAHGNLLKENSLKQKQFYLPGYNARVVSRNSIDISEERVASIFRVEEQANRDTSITAGGTCIQLNSSNNIDKTNKLKGQLTNSMDLSP